jgi:hypothetical protein
VTTFSPTITRYVRLAKDGRMRSSRMATGQDSPHLLGRESEPRAPDTATASFSEHANQDINSRSRALLCRLSFSAFLIASLVRVSPIAFISMAVTTTLRTQYVLMEKLTALLGRLFPGQFTVTVRSLPWRPRCKLC